MVAETHLHLCGHGWQVFSLWPDHRGDRHVTSLQGVPRGRLSRKLGFAMTAASSPRSCFTEGEPLQESTLTLSCSPWELPGMGVHLADRPRYI